MALIRRIQPVNRFGSPSVISSTTSHYSYMLHREQQQIFRDETTNRDELFSIGPMKWR